MQRKDRVYSRSTIRTTLFLALVGGKANDNNTNDLLTKMTCHLLRICPGRFYADANVWLVAAKVLAAFNIGPYINPVTGERTYPQAVFQPYLVR